MFEMDINKTDMFEKFFNGFQEKFIEPFKAAGEEKIHVQLLENHKASKESYRTYFNCAWEFLEKTIIAHQQAKVEELEVKLKGAEERAQLILQYKDKYRLERDELQKRVDLVKRELKAAKEGHYGFKDEGTDIDGFIFDLEQALKGEGQ